MKGLKRCIVFLALLFMGGVVTAPLAWGHSDVLLKDKNGNWVGNSGEPYSPKVTCSANGCHDTLAYIKFQLDNTIYESSATNATKDHGPGSPSYGSAYKVPYPLHGVTAGYHFQQGRNVSWGDVQRDYYGLPSFTSSPGMYGKY